MEAVEGAEHRRQQKTTETWKWDLALKKWNWQPKKIQSEKDREITVSGVIGRRHKLKRWWPKNGIYIGSLVTPYNSKEFKCTRWKDRLFLKKIDSESFSIQADGKCQWGNEPRCMRTCNCPCRNYIKTVGEITIMDILKEFMKVVLCKERKWIQRHEWRCKRKQRRKKWLRMLIYFERIAAWMFDLLGKA